jgi:ribose/xylose/arabinose/galactoside ABC-type transport system permease subunit
MKTNKINISRIVSSWALPILLIIFVILFSVLTPNFLTQLNLTNILVQNVHVAVLTAAVMIIMISGGCDLSIGYQVSVTAVVMTKLISDFSVPVPLAVLIGVAVCLLLGTFNGFIALQLKSHTMMVTLGTMAVFQGLSYLISDSKTFFSLPDSYKYIGQGRLFGWLPVNIIIMIIILAAVSFVMSKTYIGRHVYAVGDNPESARLAGLNVRKIKTLSFTFGGLLVAIAALLLSSRAGSADSTTGLGLEFTGITACVLGGVALKGGEGTLWRVIVAVFVLGVLSNGMQLIGLGTYPQYIAKGAIMLASIWLSNRSAPAIA